MLSQANTRWKGAQVFERQNEQRSSSLAHNNPRSDDIMMKTDVTAPLNNALVFSLPVQPVQPPRLHGSAQMMQ